MRNLKLKNRLKSDRGSITIFVLTSMFFFLVILLSIYMNNVNKSSNMDKDIKKIEEQYTVTNEDLEKAYKEIVNKNIYPKPVLDSTNVNGEDILKDSEGKYQRFDGGDYYPTNTTNQNFPVLSPEPKNGGYSFDGDNVITISATIKISDLRRTSKQYFIVGCTEGGGWDLHIQAESNKIRLAIHNGDGYDQFDSNDTIKENILYNIIATFSRGKMRMYVMDEKKNQLKYELDKEEHTLNQKKNVKTLIGINPKASGVDSGYGFDGYIYDIKMWDRTLTEGQIKYLANEQIELYKDQ